MSPDDVSASLVPVRIRSADGSVEIAWSDGLAQQVTWKRLRDRCPCATCRVRRENPPPPSDDPFTILRPEETRPLRLLGVSPVGNYALALDFSDGHRTGIYTYEFLRELGGEGAPAT